MLTEFGKILRIIRINSGDSSRAMAKKLNLSPSYLSAIENGKRNIPSDIEKLLCDAYPLSSTDVMKIRKTIVGSCTSIKINLTEFAEKKKRLIFAISRDDIANETLDRIEDLIFRSERDGQK